MSGRSVYRPQTGAKIEVEKCWEAIMQRFDRLEALLKLSWCVSIGMLAAVLAVLVLR